MVDGFDAGDDLGGGERAVAEAVDVRLAKQAVAAGGTDNVAYSLSISTGTSGSWTVWSVSSGTCRFPVGTDVCWSDAIAAGSAAMFGARRQRLEVRFRDPAGPYGRDWRRRIAYGEWSENDAKSSPSVHDAFPPADISIQGRPALMNAMIGKPPPNMLANCAASMALGSLAVLRGCPARPESR